MAAISYFVLSTLKRACARGTVGPLPVMRAADVLYPPSCRRCALTRMRGHRIVFSPAAAPSGRLMRDSMVVCLGPGIERYGTWV